MNHSTFATALGLCMVLFQPRVHILLNNLQSPLVTNRLENITCVGSADAEGSADSGAEGNAGGGASGGAGAGEGETMKSTPF